MTAADLGLPIPDIARRYWTSVRMESMARGARGEPDVFTLDERAELARRCRRHSDSLRQEITPC